MKRIGLKDLYFQQPRSEEYMRDTLVSKDTYRNIASAKKNIV